MLKKKIVIIAIIFSALLVGLGVSFAFGNTINPNCPDEIKQAIQNWDKGLDERDVKNNVVAELARHKTTPIKVGDYNLRILFLSSLITLTFNTPVHSQILVSNFIQKLFTVAKHYLRHRTLDFGLRTIFAIFTTIKRYFEKIFLILLGLILPTICLLFLSIPYTLHPTPCLYYKFHNLRL